MNIRTLALILSLSVFSIAATQITILEEGIESSTSDLRLPGHSNGYILVRRCSGCAELTLSLSTGTRYLGNGEPVEHKDFRRLSRRPGHGMDIFYAPKSNRGTRVVFRGRFPAARTGWGWPSGAAN